MIDEDNAISVYTDGSCYHKTRLGGWAFFARHGFKTLTKYGHAEDTTVNRMELTAIINALDFILFTPDPLHIFTDSEYCRDALKYYWRGWEAEGWINRFGLPIKNQDMFFRALHLLERHRQFRQVEIYWVKGHNGNIDNERVDKLAHNARVGKLTNWIRGNH